MTELPNTSYVEVEDIDVEIAIAEAVQLMPPRTCYEDKGTPVLAYLKKMGWKVMEEQSAKDERDKWLKENCPWTKKNRK